MNRTERRVHARLQAKTAASLHLRANRASMAGRRAIFEISGLQAPVAADAPYAASFLASRIAHKSQARSIGAGRKL